MFEKSEIPDIPRALALNGTNSRQDMITAINWIIDHTESQKILVVRPTKNDLSHSYPELAQFLKHRAVSDTSYRTAPTYFQGPVLLLWPDSKTIGTYNQSSDTTALCVVEGSRNAAIPWAQAFKPEILNGELNSDAAALEPIVEIALESIGLSANHNNRFISTYDRDVAVNGIRSLLTRGHTLIPADVYSWTLANGWPEDSASEFKKILIKLISGTNMRVSDRWDLYSYWQSKLNDSLENRPDLT